MRFDLKHLDYIGLAFFIFLECYIIFVVMVVTIVFKGLTSSAAVGTAATTYYSSKLFLVD